MPARKKQPKRTSKKRAIAKKTPSVSMLYDDALPVSLKQQGVSSGSKVVLKTGQRGQVSPYVVHLSREELAPVQDDAARIASLKKQLLAQEGWDDVPELQEAPLAVALDDLSEQLREPDARTHAKPSRKAQPVEAHEVPAQPLALDQLAAAIQLDELTPEQEAPEIPEPTPEPTTVVVQKTRTVRFTLPTISLKLSQLPLLLPTQTRHRAIASFVALSLAVVLPLHAMQGIADARFEEADVRHAGETAIEDLHSALTAAESDRFSVASSDFERASQRFADAEASLQDMHLAAAALVSIIPETDRTLASVRGLVTAGKELSTAGSLLTDAADDLTSASSVSLVTKLHILGSYIESALPHVQQAEAALADVDPSVVPADQQDTVTQLLYTTPQLSQSMEEFLRFSEALTIILGDEEKMRYLVVFQNNTELRATGGFTGSFAEMDILDGSIDDIYIPEGGTYDVQGQLSSFVSPPEPLSLLNPRWEFHDANWFPDFPSSAQKMIDFYYDAGGPTGAGMLAINASVMPELLELTGPIEMPEYGRTIDSENFLFETQKIVEIEYAQYEDEESDRTVEAPKQFLGDLAPKILERLEDVDVPTLLQAVDLIGSALTEKDLMLYFNDNDLQRTMEELGWSGSMKQTSGDYLMVVNTNLGGGKTDSVIMQDVNVEVEVQDDGSVINTVTIVKEHLGLRSALFEGDNNVDYIRLYVPRGSELLDASGFEIPAEELFETSDVPLGQDEDLLLAVTEPEKDFATGTDIWQESGKTVFGNWMQTAPGETETVTFTYRLPLSVQTDHEEKTFFDIAAERLGFKQLETYSLLVQKQPGVETRTTTVSVSLPSTLDVIWASDEGITAQTGVSFDNTQDEFLHFVAER